MNVEPDQAQNISNRVIIYCRHCESFVYLRTACDSHHMNQSASMLQGLAIFTGIIATVLCLIHYLVHGVRKGRLIDRIPGPYAWPITGNVIQHMVSPEKLWTLTRRLSKEYYGIRRVWNFILPVLELYHPDDVEVLLTSSKHIDKSSLYRFLHPWLGTGLLTSSGKKWHQRRKILTPAFHFNVLQQCVGTLIEQSNIVVESLCPDGEEVVDDLVSLLHKYTLNSICETALDYKTSVNEEVLREYRSCVHFMGELLVYRLLRLWLHIDSIFRWTGKFAGQCRALKVLHRFSTDIITARKQYHKDTNGQYLKGLGDEEAIYAPDEDYRASGKRLAMLDLLISASQRGDKIDDEGIREEVDTFIFEGHDTTAMALCFALLLLAENKEIQDNARAEVDEVFGKRNGGSLTFRDIQRLGYLDRCMKESLRLFPSVPFISRQISEYLQLKKYLVPGGTIVNVHIYDLHRDPVFWPNPTTFDPDRFLPENTLGRHPFAYVPFSAGPRNCIGQKFAMLEMKALVGNILHKFYLEPIDLSGDVVIMSDLVIRPKTPIRMKLIRRLNNERK